MSGQTPGKKTENKNRSSYDDKPVTPKKPKATKPKATKKTRKPRAPKK